MKEQNQRIYSFGNFQLDVGNRQLRCGDRDLPLSAKAFDLLLALVENNGRLMKKDDLFVSVWQGQIVEESNLTVHISQIRKALGETKKNPRFIETVPGYGYRFIGDVSSSEDEEIIIETETLSRITIETESPARELPEKENSSLAYFAASPKKTASILTLCTVLICLILVIGFYFLSAKNRNPPFEKVKLIRLTNNGKVSVVTLSPDGKFIAYVLNEAEGNSLWIRQTGTANDTRIMLPVKPLFRSLTFTPDGTQLYYSLFSSDKPDFEFYRVPTLGGVSQKLPGIIAHSISFSPDGKHFAFIQPDSEAGKSYLVIADADGANQRVIAQKLQPNTFISEGDFTAWSPDGETIACLIDHLDAESNYTSIVGINPKDGTERPLSEKKWYDTATFAWVKDGSGLIVAGSEKISSKNQLWFLPQPTGEIRPLTENSNDYSSISTSADSNSFIALQTESVNGISVGEPNGEENSFKEIVSEVGDLFPLTWTAGGKIIFRSSADGTPNLWMVDPDGTNRHQLTIEAKATERAMCATPDGKFIVFVSWRSGRSNLWRVNTDGSDLTPLTGGEADAYPACMPDSQTIVYQRGILTRPNLWKVSINGGEPVQLTDFWAKWAAISTDGRQVSFFQMSRDKWHIGLIPSAGGPILRLLDVPVVLKESPTQWSSDDKSLFFIGTIGSIGNVWSLPLDGGGSKPITDFKSRYMEDFAISPDGTKLAVLRSTELSDVVLVEKVR